MIARIADEFYQVADAAAAFALAKSKRATLDQLEEDAALVEVSLASVMEAKRLSTPESTRAVYNEAAKGKR